MPKPLDGGSLLDMALREVLSRASAALQNKPVVR